MSQVLEVVQPQAVPRHSAAAVLLEPSQCLSGSEEIIFDPNDSHRILPTHRLSGLPLPVLPIEPRNKGSQLWTDYDHSFYPRMSRELRGIGGAAVRCSRGQDLPRWLHNRKHGVFPDGPQLPRTWTQKYVASVLACAGFIPRQAIDLTRDGTYDIVEMSDRQVRDLADSRTLHIQDAHHPAAGRFYRDVIGRFFAFYAVTRDLSNISEAVISEFIETRNETRKKELGNLLLDESIDRALGPVRQLRRDIQDQGMVQLGRSDPQATVRKFFIKARYPDYYDELGRRLRSTVNAA